MLRSTSLCRMALAGRTNQSLMTAPSQLIVAQRRTFSQTQIHREEEEEDEEEKAKREKLAKLYKPAPLPGMVPRRRRGLTVDTFLEKIGKGCSEHKDKFTSWEELFTFKSRTLKLKEIPTKQRRWILTWVERYRQGDTPGYEK